jgi:general stress protein 26
MLMISPSHAEGLWNKIKHIKTAMLVSQDGEILRARPMYMVQKTFSGTLYFYTGFNSQKADEIRDNAMVNVSFADEEHKIFVSLSGHAVMSKDSQLVEEFWSPAVAAWYPGGKEDPNVGLIVINAVQAEYWETTANAMVTLFEYVKANVTGTPPDIGINRKFG